VLAAAAALGVAGFMISFIGWHDPATLFGVHVGPGAFYRLMPHDAMAMLFGAVFLYALVAIGFGVRAFWRDIGAPAGTGGDPRSILQAVGDVGRLRYLDGGGGGCMNEDERPSDRRRLYHHLAFYGFLLCFAATSVATVYHYLLGRVAPYPWWDLPVVLGTLGGLGLVIGPIGLLGAKWRRDPMMLDRTRYGMDVAFTLMLLLTSATGLALLVLRATPAMGLLLALHLGVVFALFLTLPYSDFVHGIYRYLALVRYARERRS
jgi:citrate/tricarballylate utilization protein